jgi:hypothetical protein
MKNIFSWERFLAGGKEVLLKVSNTVLAPSLGYIFLETEISRLFLLLNRHGKTTDKEKCTKPTYWEK